MKLSPQFVRSQSKNVQADSMRVQYLHQTEGGAVTNKRATAVYRLKDKKKKNKQNKETTIKQRGNDGSTARISVPQ